MTTKQPPPSLYDDAKAIAKNGYATRITIEHLRAAVDMAESARASWKEREAYIVVLRHLLSEQFRELEQLSAEVQILRQKTPLP